MTGLETDENSRLNQLTSSRENKKREEILKLIRSLPDEALDKIIAVLNQDKDQ